MNILGHKTSTLIRNARLRKGIGQAELGALLGYTPNGQFVSNIERGLARVPVDKIVATARILGISPEEIRDALIADFTIALNRNIKAQLEVRSETYSHVNNTDAAYM